MSKDTTASSFNIKQINVHILCIKKQWQQLENYVRENKMSLHELAEALRSIMKMGLDKENASIQFSCITQIAKKLKDEKVSEYFPKIAITNKGDILTVLCYAVYCNCLKSLIDIKDIFEDDAMYIILRRPMPTNSFKLLINHVSVDYLNKSEYSYVTDRCCEKFTKPLLHALLTNGSDASWRMLLQVPVVDLNVRDKEGKTAWDVLCKKKIDGLKGFYAKYNVLNKIITERNNNNTIDVDDDQSNEVVYMTTDVPTAKVTEDAEISNTSTNSFKQISSYNDNRIEDSMQSVSSFEMKYLDHCSIVDVMSFLREDINFADKEYVPVKNSQTVAQRIVALMRYDLMEAIVKYTKKIPSSISINDIIMHSWRDELSNQHAKYTDNVGKFVKLFIDYGQNMNDIQKIAEIKKNAIISEFLLGIKHSNIIDKQQDIGSEKQKIEKDINGNNANLSLCEEKETSILKSAQVSVTQDSIDTNTSTVQQDLNPTTNKYYIPKLVEALRSLMKDLVANSVNQLEYITHLSKKLQGKTLPEDCEPITIIKTSRSLEMLCVEYNIQYLECLISIKQFFADNTMYLLLRNAKSERVFNLLINHVDLAYMNQAVHTYDYYGEKVSIDVPFVHLITKCSKTLFNRVSEIPGLDLNIRDKNGKTVLDILNECRSDLSNNEYTRELYQKKYDYWQKIIQNRSEKPAEYIQTNLQNSEQIDADEEELLISEEEESLLLSEIEATAKLEAEANLMLDDDRKNALLYEHEHREDGEKYTNEEEDKDTDLYGSENEESNLEFVEGIGLRKLNMVDSLFLNAHWKDAVNHLTKHVVTFNSLVQNLEVLLISKWHARSIPTIANAINTIANKMQCTHTFSSPDPISIPKDKLLLLVKNPKLIDCIDGLMNINYIFKENLLDTLLQHSVLYTEAFNKLMTHTNAMHLNQCICSTDDGQDIPFLHLVCVNGSAEVLKKVVEMEGVDLIKLDKNNKTAADLLCEEVKMLGDNNNMQKYYAYKEKMEILISAFNEEFMDIDNKHAEKRKNSVEDDGVNVSNKKAKIDFEFNDNNVQMELAKEGEAVKCVGEMSSSDEV